MKRLAFITTIYFLLILIIQVRTFGKQKKEPAILKLDTTAVQARSFNKNALEKHHFDKDFDYREGNPQAGERSLWSRIWGWIWHKIQEAFDQIPNGSYFFKYLLLGLSIALLVYIVFQMLKIDAIQLLRGASKKAGVTYSESLENIHQIDFDADIEMAITQHNYRLAIRLLYLRCLKQLSDKNLIRWENDKTNSAYLQELKNPVQKQTFSKLTKQFEFVWYGNFVIDQTSFSDINTLFLDFRKQLS